MTAATKEIPESFERLMRDPFSAITRARQNSLVVASGVVALVSIGVIRISGGRAGVEFTVENAYAVMAGVSICFYFMATFASSAALDLLRYKHSEDLDAFLTLVIDRMEAPAIDSLVTMREISRKFDALRDDTSPDAVQSKARLIDEAKAQWESLDGTTEEARRLYRKVLGLRTARRIQTFFELALPLAIGLIAIATVVAAASQ